MSYNAPIVEDCRDFLRTGRCKYGMSCKYNHPPNVLNGGGIKPSDPSELLFPIRPNEPLCDYFMKHRTCKFGSACKFNHPPHSDGMYSGIMAPPPPSSQPRRPEPVQLVLSPVGTEVGPNGQIMMMQYLPQRPGEPDCIYFLKNRSCKYGATCRYHHPVLSRQRQPDTTRPKQRQHDAFTNSNRPGQRVQYVIPSYSHHLGQDLLSSESPAPVTVITMDGSSAQGYIVSSEDSGPTFCIPVGSVGFTEQSSSASSVGSSLETSNGDFLQGDSRIRRNTSAGSFNSEVRQQGGSYLPHSMSEGNIAQRRTRAASFGSVDGTGGVLHYDPNGLSWSQRARGASFGSRQDQGQQYHYGTNMQRHRSTVPGRPRANHGPDEGFTRMTSALLNMLDTPEEAASEGVSDEETPSHNRVRPYRGDSAVASDMLARLQLTPHHSDGPQAILRTEISHYGDNRVGDRHQSAFLRSLSGGRDIEATTANLRSGPSTSWFPTWTGSSEQHGEPFSMLNQTQNSPNSKNQSQHANGSDIGMYLP